MKARNGPRYPLRSQRCVPDRPLIRIVQRLNLRQETDRIDDLARVDLPAARKALDVMLDRVKRLEGHDQETAMSFNAKLVSELRERNPRLFVTYRPPENANGQPLPMS